MEELVVPIAFLGGLDAIVIWSRENSVDGLFLVFVLTLIL